MIIKKVLEISVINIKKSPGGGKTKKDKYNIEYEIARAYEENKNILKEQIEIYKPQIIICVGSNNNNTLDYFFNDKQNKIFETLERYETGFEKKKRNITDCYAPAAAHIRLGRFGNEVARQRSCRRCYACLPPAPIARKLSYPTPLMFRLRRSAIQESTFLLGTAKKRKNRRGRRQRSCRRTQREEEAASLLFAFSAFSAVQILRFPSVTVSVSLFDNERGTGFVK
jgi:hypothetical protein